MVMAIENESAKWRDNLSEFEVAARAYVAFVDSLAAGRPKPFYRTLHRLLTDLAQAERMLDFAPHLYDDVPDADDEVARHISKWSELDDMFTALISPEVAITGTDHDFEDRKHTLFTDLSELYLDLAEGLTTFDSDHPFAAENAAWAWRFKYGHWGDHLFRALWTIHQIRCWSGINASETREEDPELWAKLERELRGGEQ